MLLLPLGQKNCNYNWPSLPHFKVKFISIDHFRVASSLCFKARLRAKPFIWKWFFILMHLKLVFSNKCFALSLVLKVRRRGLINRENETIITIEAFWILVLWQLHVNSYGNTQIWYPASFIVDNLFVGIGYFFIYLPWNSGIFLFLHGWFFSFLFTIRSSTYLFLRR